MVDFFGSNNGRKEAELMGKNVKNKEKILVELPY